MLSHTFLLFFSFTSHSASLRLNVKTSGSVQNGTERPLQLERLPLCDMAEYASGTWAPVNKKTKSFVCCNSDNDPGSGGVASCQKGKVVGGLQKSYSGDGTPFKYITSGGHACSCDATPSTLDRVLDIEKYEWQPSTCQMEAFDANRLCLMLENRRLLILGDSTAEQTGTTLMNLIRAGSLDGKGCSKNVQVRLTDSFGMSKDRVHDASKKWYKKKMVLAKTSFEETELIPKFVGLVRDAIQESTENDVVLLSSGPHWHSEQGYQEFLNSIKKQVQEKRKQNDSRVFLWKTINGGGCGPIGTEDGLIEQQAKDYSWDKFKQFDAMAASTFQSISPPLPLLNVSMLYQRGDAHPGAFKSGDCLHFCTPGPLDVIAPILSHVLRGVL